jgi:hypothetical protein
LLRSPIRIAGLILKYDDQSYGRGNTIYGLQPGITGRKKEDRQT